MKPLIIIEQPIASASLERANKKYPKFENYWVNGVSWMLVRKPDMGVQIPDINPPRYALGINQWRAGGIPRMSIVYRHLIDEGRILLERVTFHDKN